jgi:transcription initiation factor IIE alpha subunit
MKVEHHPFESEIFEAFRIRQKKINKAIELLKEHDYIILKKEKV